MTYGRIVASAIAIATACGCRPSSDAPLPSFADVRAAYRKSDHLVVDRTGRILHERRVDHTVRRLEWAALASISPPLVDAVLAAEDRRFRSHHGVDWFALARAAMQTMRGGGRRGGSTITMQVARLLDTAERPHASALQRKWRQMRRARAIERDWSKDEILETYLNLLPVRGEIQGISAAARLLFGVAPEALTRSQAVVIAAGIPAPNATQAWLRRRSRALAVRFGHDDLDAIDRAVAHVVARPRPSAPQPSLAPHVATRILSAGGPQLVVTTIDAALQRRARDSLDAQLRMLAHDDVRDGAVLIADNRSGDVLAYIGSSGELSAAAHVDGVRAARQAGSTLKPFLYGLALEERLLTAVSPLRDAPLEISMGAGAYRPTNYDDAYRGIVSLRTALAASLNVPAVRTLELIGQDRFLDLLQRLGFTTLTRSAEYYGPGLALGVGEVTLWDLVRAYAALARGGVPLELRLTHAAASASESVPPIFSAETAYLVADILADRDARSGTFGLDGALTTPFRAAVKTGTSTDMRDNWCIGFTTQYTVGVWVGNFSGAPMGDVSGVTGAAPIWAELMTWLQRDVAATTIAPPPGLIEKNVATPSGAERQEWFVRGTEPAGDRVAMAPPAAAIQSPVDGSIVAIDPGIPAASQRIAFISAPRVNRQQWWLGGETLGSAGTPLLWEPRAGEHVLELRDASGEVLARSRFRVRAAGR